MLMLNCSERNEANNRPGNTKYLIFHGQLILLPSISVQYSLEYLSDYECRAQSTV
jgi:hypothetical protein